MDLIYEAYTNQLFNEVVSKYTQVKNSLDRPIGKILAKIADKTESNAKGVFYKDASHSNLNLPNEYKILQKEIGFGNVGIAIIRDLDTNLFQRITVFGGSKNYNPVGAFNKAKDFREIEEMPKQFEANLKPMPSASDVNRSIRPRGRM